MTPLDERTKYCIAAQPEGVFVAVECVIPEEIALLIADRAEQYVQQFADAPPEYREIVRRLSGELRAAVDESRRMR